MPQLGLVFVGARWQLIALNCPHSRRAGSWAPSHTRRSGRLFERLRPLVPSHIRRSPVEIRGGGGARRMDPNCVCVGMRAPCGEGRVAWLFKSAVLKAASSAPYLRSAQQLLAAKHILKRTKWDRGMKARSGLGFVKTGRLKYIHASRRLMQSCRWAHFVCDATSIGGRKWLQIVNWSVERGVGFWCIPQARRVSKRTPSIAQRRHFATFDPPFCPYVRQSALHDGGALQRLTPPFPRTLPGRPIHSNLSGGGGGGAGEAGPPAPPASNVRCNARWAFFSAPKHCKSASRCL